MKIWVKFFVLATLGGSLAVVPLLAQDVNTDYDHDYKFNLLKGYSWGKVEASDPTVEPRIAAAVDHVLIGYGFKESSKAGDAATAQYKPTTMVVTAVEASNPAQYEAFYRSMSNLDWHRGWGSHGFSNDATSPRQVHGGTLIVDIYDGATGKLIWRGTAAEGMNKKEQADVDKEVNTLFANFPPKSGGPMVPNQQEVPPSASSPPLQSPN